MTLQHPMSAGGAPAWASAWGEDRFGPWAELQVGTASQRMRWIRPGTYLRGSPEDEAGRWDDEGPQHEVTLTRGFWLGDTPVTQALWEAVMGGNPSRFVDPQRPVERVSWNEARACCEALAARLPSLAPRLPTEAEWEYACRAGTSTATWVGDLELVGTNNAPQLDAIAWYGGNSGVDYDLDEAENSSGWRQKQHPHSRAGTRRVATRQASPWGLYDMLGNVLEWCEDGWESYAAAPSVDPYVTTGQPRVFRGGSWNDLARGVRAASRAHYDPGNRYGPLGFRLAGGPTPGGGAQAGDRPPPKARDAPGSEPT